VAGAADEAVPGTLNLLNADTRAEFTPSAACPPPNEDKKCFDANSEFHTAIESGLKSADGRSVYCGLGAGCDTSFKIGNLMDAQSPAVSIVSPRSGGYVPQGNVDVSVLATDDMGVARVEFFVDNVSIGIAAASGEKTFSAMKSWDATALALGSAHDLKAVAYDACGNSALSQTATVTIRAANYFNGIQDGDETGIDCGGASGVVCNGGSCTSGSQCASGVCQNGVCVAGPVITALSSFDGAPGNLVTIWGYNFGASPGGGVTLSGVAALSGCANSWSDNQIIMIVPSGAATGKIRVTNNANLSGETINNFVVNDIIRPGICTIAPPRGLPGAVYTIAGKNFGATKDAVVFDTRLSDTSSWADTGISGAVPFLTEGRYVVKAKVGSESSNGVYFAINPPVGGTPVISSINPASGPPGEYITIFGQNFGTATGQVLFLRGADTADGDTNFPSGCGADYWHNNSITVKVPSVFRDGNRIETGAIEAQVKRSDNYLSNKEDFTVTTGAPKPGICRLDPDNGPPLTTVNIFGERLGARPEGAVNFWQNKTVAGIAALSWAEDGVRAAVPSGAASGPVYVSSAGTKSNALNFKVGDCAKDANLCNATTQQCCGNGSCILKTETCALAGPQGSFLWRFSTGPIVQVPAVDEHRDCSDGATQSPSPWKGSVDGCVNALVSARFTVPMSASIPPGAVKLEDCTGAGGAFDTGACADVLPLNVSWDGGNTIILSATGNLLPNHSYQATLRKTLTSAANVPMDRDYVWAFRTLNDPNGCALASVALMPRSATIAQSIERQDYSAYPSAVSCNVLKCEAKYDFNWSTSNSNAAMENARIVSDVCLATAKPLMETGTTPVKVIAASPPNSKSGQADLFVKYTPPRIIKYWPSSGCPANCSNAEVGGEFNVEMDAATINSDNIKIYDCGSDDTCSFTAATLPPAKTATVNYTSTLTAKTFSIGVSLEPGKSYLVRVNGMGAGGVKSVSGAALTGLNPAPYFQWTFKIKNNAGICRVDRVEVSPLEALIRLMLTATPFAATPYGPPDECNPKGPRLQVLDAAGGESYTWGWDSTVTTIGVMDPADPVPLSYGRNVKAVGGPGESRITAVADAKTNPPPSSRFITECVCQADSECPATPATPLSAEIQNGCGVTDHCCWPRPKVESAIPVGEGVCRNALLEAAFNQVIIHESIGGEISKCGGGAAFDSGACQQVGVKGVLESSAQNGKTSAKFVPEAAWDANMWYQIKVYGGAGGVKNTSGVAMAADYIWTFKTGAGLCVLDEVKVEPTYHLFRTTIDNPDDNYSTAVQYDQIDDGDKKFSAEYISKSAGSQQLAPIPDVYFWTPRWLSNDPTVVGIINNSADDAVVAAAQNKNGAAELVLSVTISGNSVPADAPRVLNGSAKAEVFLCQNIWPAPAAGEAIFGLKDSGFNFRTFYCRDIKEAKVGLFRPASILRWASYIYKKAVAQITGGTEKGEQILGTLPSLNLVELEYSAAKPAPAPDILKEYLLQNPNTRDAIGIRVLRNENHLSPLRWYYEEKKFKGSPQPLIIEGYEAIQDGRSVYIAAVNYDTPPAAGPESGQTYTNKIFTNIYLLSYNEGASDETKEIFKQILNNFKLNTNLTDQRVCVGGAAVCENDFDCPAAKCGGYAAARGGSCSTAPLQTCSTDAGCPAAACEAGQPAQAGTCNTGLSSQPCTSENVNSICPSSSCLGGQAGTPKTCSNSGAQCSADADCGATVANFSLAGIGSIPQGVAYDETNNLVWVSNFGSSRLAAINPSDGSQNGNPVIVDTWSRKLIYNAPDLYLAGLSANSITKINPLTRAVVWRKDVPLSPQTIVYAQGYVFAAGSGNIIVRIPEDVSGEASAIQIPTGSPNVFFIGSVYAGGRVWFSEIYSQKIYGIDPLAFNADNLVIATPSGGLAPGALAADGSWLYAAMYGDRAIEKYTFEGLAQGLIYQDTPGTSWINGFIADGDYLWFNDNFNSKVYKLDKNTRLVAAEYSAESGTWFMAKGGGNIWTANSNANSLTRIAIAPPVCREGQAAVSGACSGSNNTVSCTASADCAGVQKICNNYQPAGPGKCAGSDTSCSSNADCSSAAKCNDAVPEIAGSCVGGSTACRQDADCGAAVSVCDADKSKLARDTKRLSDFLDIQKSLDAYNIRNGYYPRLESGSFLRSVAVSKWASWQGTLGSDLRLAKLPTDPVNKLRDCERASVSPIAAIYSSGFT
ncbi:MAG: IPT/TIG domain-containing protein, partial [Patescibacteria group bacterium]